MKILIDVPVDEEALAQLRASVPCEVDCLVPPAEKARDVDPARLRDVDALFCSFPPKNLADMKALRWVQIASAGYTQLFGLELAAKGIRATNALGCFDV